MHNGRAHAGCALSIASAVVLCDLYSAVSYCVKASASGARAERYSACALRPATRFEEASINAVLCRGWLSQLPELELPTCTALTRRVLRTCT
jgi:hypothetical protein